MKIPAIGLCLLFTSLCFAQSPDQLETTTGPNYKDAPETSKNSRVDQGELKRFTMDSKDSEIYPGIAKGKKGTVPYKRKVDVYLPAKFRKSREYPFMVVQDGNWYRGVMPRVLDNMIDDKRLPPMVVIFASSGGGDAQGSQRGLEYDTVSGVYTEWVEKELLPAVTEEFGVKFTDDPQGRATMGGSSGAAAAFTMAWFHPELYSKVLSYSGTYVNQQSPKNPELPHGAWEYHERLIGKSPKKDIRVWLQVSDKDNGWNKEVPPSLHNWVRANQNMAEALKEKGYDYRFVFSKNAKHIDGKVMKQTLPDALEWLWKGYEAAR